MKIIFQFMVIVKIFCLNLLPVEVIKATPLEFPALGTGVLIQGKSESVTVSGIRKNGNQTNVTELDKWHIGSCTKSMTATLTAIIINSGQYPSLNWNTKLKDIFDFDIHSDFKNLTLPEILAHRSGIEDPHEWDSLEQILIPLNNNVIKIRSAVSKYFLTKASSYDRKTTQEAHYSNVGYVIVGAVLEKVTGLSWEKLMSDFIFIPLEMSSAGFGSPASEILQNPDHPWGHTDDLVPTLEDNPLWLGPAGTVHLSIKDFLKYLNIHIDGYNGLDTKILPASAFGILHKYIDNNSDLNAGGWIVGERNGIKVFQAFGSNSFNLAAFRVIPSLKAAIVIVSNYPDTKEAITIFAEILDNKMNSIKAGSI